MNLVLSYKLPAIHSGARLSTIWCKAGVLIPKWILNICGQTCWGRRGMKRHPNFLRLCPVYMFPPLISDAFTAWGKHGNNRQDAWWLNFLSSPDPKRRPLFVRAAGSKLIRNSRHCVGRGTPGLALMIPVDDLYPIINNQIENMCLQFYLETHLFSLIGF